MKRELALITKTGIAASVSIEPGPANHPVPHVKLAARCGDAVHYHTVTFAGRSDYSYEKFEKEIFDAAAKLAERAAAKQHGRNLIEFLVKKGGES